MPTQDRNRTVLGKPLPPKERPDPVQPSAPAEPPPPTLQEIGPVERDYLRRRRLKWVLLIGGLSLAGLGILGTCALFLFSGHGPLAGPPETCRGVAERLQARGMDIDWMASSYMLPAIYIVKKGSGYSAHALDVNRDVWAITGWPEGVVVVVQYPTSDEAREEAGTMKSAFSWGRFLFLGDPGFVKQIKSRL
jgi:hypothetical protein